MVPLPVFTGGGTFCLQVGYNVRVRSFIFLLLILWKV